MNYRVLIIEDDRETIDRVVNLVFPAHLDLAGNSWEIETHTLYVEVIEKRGMKGEFEISSRCIKSLIDLCDKKFDLIIADFGYSKDSLIYDELLLDNKGEIPLENLTGKAFTPEDLISKVKQYALSSRGKKRSNLTQNFLNFAGDLVVYSYQDARFNKVYHTIGERGRITRNVFPQAKFDKIYDIKAELLDANEHHKTDTHFFAFLKCKFINNIIQLRLRERLLSTSFNTSSHSKNQKQAPLRFQESPGTVVSVLREKRFWRSWDFLKLLAYFFFFIIPIIIVPYLAISRSDLQIFSALFFKERLPAFIIIVMGYLTIFLGTLFYMIILYSEVRESDPKHKILGPFYWIAGLALFASALGLLYGMYDISRPLDNKDNPVATLLQNRSAEEIKKENIDEMRRKIKSAEESKQHSIDELLKNINKPEDVKKQRLNDLLQEIKRAEDSKRQSIEEMLEKNNNVEDFQKQRTAEIQQKVKSAERYTILIFLSLLFIDLSTYSAKRLQIRRNVANESDDTLKHISEKNFIRNQILLIEIPVMAGIILTGAFAESTRTYFNLSPDEENLFISNFVPGAIAMHIVYSQFVFVLLNAHKIINDFRETRSPRLVPLWGYIACLISIAIICLIGKYLLKLF